VECGATLQHHSAQPAAVDWEHKQGKACCCRLGAHTINKDGAVHCHPQLTNYLACSSASPTQPWACGMASACCSAWHSATLTHLRCGVGVDVVMEATTMATIAEHSVPLQ
jgi:hypothetical protein